jgi:hypothetical protein
LCVCSLDAFAQSSDNHTVTIQVADISVIDVTASSLTLDVLTGDIVVGRDLMTITDQSSSLLWGTNGSGRKITASTSLAAPKFELRLSASNPTRGTPTPEFALSTLPQDLLLDIGRSLGSCVLQYTGIAYASQGTGTDIHSISFTIVAQ